ncbi:MAG: hypothetical protein ACOYOB_20510, partial [Myxococcota bacterium]
MAEKTTQRKQRRTPWLTTVEAARYMRMTDAAEVEALVEARKLRPDGRAGQAGTHLFLTATLDRFVRSLVREGRKLTRPEGPRAPSVRRSVATGVVKGRALRPAAAALPAPKRSAATRTPVPQKAAGAELDLQVQGQCKTGTRGRSNIGVAVGSIKGYCEALWQAVETGHAGKRAQELAARQSELEPEKQLALQQDTQAYRDALTAAATQGQAVRDAWRKAQGWVDPKADGPLPRVRPSSFGNRERVVPVRGSQDVMRGRSYRDLLREATAEALGEDPV